MVKISGHVKRMEPEEAELLEAYEKVAEIFRQEDWFSFCDRLKGENYEVARAFAEGFNGQNVQLGYMMLEVNEAFIRGDNISTNRWLEVVQK